MSQVRWWVRIESGQAVGHNPLDDLKRRPQSKLKQGERAKTQANWLRPREL